MFADNLDFDALPTPPGPRFRRGRDKKLLFQYHTNVWILANRAEGMVRHDIINAAIVAFEAQFRRDDLHVEIRRELLERRAAWWAARERANL